MLQTIAAFRMPTQYKTLLAVCTGENKTCADSKTLDNILTELEDRGILGWERQSDRYDLHPVVRGAAWTLAGSEVQTQAYSALQGYFEATPTIENYLHVNSLEDLTSAIELYHALIGLGRFGEARTVYCDRLQKALLYRLGTSRQQKELLEKLFPNGLENPPRLTNPGDIAYTYAVLGLAYQMSGEPGKGSFFFEKQNEIQRNVGHQQNLAFSLGNLSVALRLSGSLQNAADAARSAITIDRNENIRGDEADNLRILAGAFLAIGQEDESKEFLEQSLQISIEINHPPLEGVINDDLSKHALTRARAINYVEEELPALIALAELARQQDQPTTARELLNDVWEAAERGPFPLHHADAYHVLCQIERDADNHPAAIAAAEQACRLAWCDGPPWAYHFGLENARRHLRELGVTEPEMGESFKPNLSDKNIFK